MHRRRPAPPLIALLAVIALAPLARGQMPIETDQGTYISPLSGREFNNPTSAVIDSAMLRRQAMNQIFNNMLMNQALANAAMNDAFRKIGQPIIDAGRATSAVPKWDDEAAGWVLSDSLEGAEREAAVRQLRADWAAYSDLARSRGADPNDAADIVALAAVVGYEHLRDAKTTQRQLTAVAAAVRGGLLIDPLYQGKGARGAAELAAKWAFATLALERNAAEAETDEQKQQVRDAGGALLGGLYPTPADALEPVEDGFIDRGERIVKEGRGATTFRRTIDDMAMARELTVGEMPQIPMDAASLFGEPGDDRPYEARLAEAKEARAKGVDDALRGFRAEAKKRGLPDDDLAAGAAHATALLWPIAGDDHTPLSPAQVESARTLFAGDIVADPAFQRLDDAQRQRVYDSWAYRAVVALGDVETAKAAAAAAAESAKSDDPMTQMMGLSQQGVADSSLNLARSRASALLGDFFAPRRMEKVSLEADGFKVAE